MAYTTGDIHGDPRDLLRFSEVHSLTSEDTIIILGDAGFNFDLHGRDHKTKKLAARIPATLLCIHGNHEAPSSRFLDSIMRKSASEQPSWWGMRSRISFLSWMERSMT